MDNDNDKNLFEIRIDEASKRFIRKIHPLVSISFIANVLLAVTIVCVSIYSLKIQRRIPVDSIRGFYLRVYPVYTIIYTLIATAGGYYYFLYVKNLRKAVVLSDEGLFNKSFKYVYLNAIFFTIAMVMAFLFSVFQVLAIWA